MLTVDTLYEQQIRSLPVNDKLQLISRIAEGLADAAPWASRRRSITELRGLGKEIWQSVNAQQYVNELREEWEK